MKQRLISFDKEFKLTLTKMLTEVRKRIDDLSENFNKEIENMKNASQLNNAITEIKTTIQGMNSRLLGVEERTSVMEDREKQNNQAEEQRKKELLKMRRCQGFSATNPNKTILL